MQIQSEDNHSLKGSKRNAKRRLKRITKTGKSPATAVHGKTDTDFVGRRSYEKVNEVREQQTTLRSLKRGLEELEVGNTVGAIVVHQRLRKL